MSYDLFTFNLPPGADPSDYATEVVESFDDEQAPAGPPVSSLVAAFRAAFPNAEVFEREEDSAMISLEEGLISIDVFPSHCDICVSYGPATDAARLMPILARIGAAAASAGHNTMFDAQLDEPVDLSEPDAMAGVADAFSDSQDLVDGMVSESEQGSGGLFGRLFRRR